jgi:hypothetical protein
MLQTHSVTSKKNALGPCSPSSGEGEKTPDCTPEGVFHTLLTALLDAPGDHKTYRLLLVAVNS